MDEPKASDRRQDGKVRVKTPTTSWGTIKKLYLKSERPRARRYRFVASIELTDVQSEIHHTEQTSDLSLFGCRVGSGKLLPAGIRVRVRIVHMGGSFVALGKIVYALPNAGMGVLFTEIEPNYQLVLESWIAQLRDPRRAGKT